MASDAWPRARIAAGALALALAAGCAGARLHADGSALTFTFIACMWACAFALALIWRGARLLAAPARLEVAVGVPQEHAQLAARVLALELQLEHAPVALFRIDPAPVPALVEPINASARRLLAPGRATDAQEVRRALAALVAGQRSVIDFAAEQGTERALATAGAMIVEGKPQRLAALLPMENELEAEAIQAWQRLVHVLTHEIMNSLTPVASLSRTLRTLLDGTGMPAATVQDFATALDAIGRRADSLTVFVSAYRALASVPDAQPQVVVVAQMFARLAALAAPSWEARGGKARFVVEPEALELMADPGQLEQALMNLLINAGEAGAGQVTVSARAARGGRLRIEVCDDGPGVPDELIADIFTPFFSTKNRGSGIGLAMVRQLVHRNGGAVRYAKSVGSGARFVVTF
jgi:signal transduction histidine kinase